MSHHRRRRNAAGLLGGVAMLASIGLASLTVPVATASELPPGNTIVIGSGSQTAYALMTSFDDLFNQSQGCNEVATPSETQSLSFNCPTGAAHLAAAAGENPVNDVTLQEPPLGGSNGLKQIEGQVPVVQLPASGGGTASEPIGFATTVRNPSTSDPPGLNFVNYALDGVSWFHFTKVGKTVTPSAGVKSLTIAQLAGIWTGTITNWDKVGGTNAEIHVYATNSGSGLLSIWDTDLGGINAQTYPQSKFGPSHIIEQNEDASILANKDEADAIFFFSIGRYDESCKVVCGGTKLPGGGSAALGKINGVSISSTTIRTGLWPVRVYLSNVYSDGSSKAIPAASQAALNFVSEDGFLCKAQLSGGKHINDPTTGLWYRTEIQDLITSQGFVPIPLGREGTVAHPAVLKAPYKAYDSSGTDPEGYCRVTTTDGNA